MIVAFVLAAVLVLVDQLTKLWLYGKSCSLIGDFLWLESPELNTGASFGIFSGKTIFLVLFSIPVIVLICYMICSNKLTKSKFFKASLGIILGGTIGNLIDRIFLGGVRDFIYLKSINFAIFNFADIFINIGIYMIIGYLLYYYIKELKAKKLEKQNAVQDSENKEPTMITVDPNKPEKDKDEEKQEAKGIVVDPSKFNNGGDEK